MKVLRYNQGLAALTTMVIVMVILVVLIASYGLITASTARQFSNVYQSARAYYAAEAGAEDGIVRYLRSAGTLVEESWAIVGLSSGTADVAVTTGAQSTLTTTSSAGGRERKIKVTLNLNSIYTYAGFIGAGGLWMSDSTDIKCVRGTGCRGEDEAGDAGTVWVNGPVWANGSDSGGKLGKSTADARVVGNVYATGKVDIRPSEKKEPSPNTANHKFACLGTNISDSNCAIKATAIAQKVRIHEGGKRTKRFAFRIAYHGTAGDLPTVRAYPVRQTSGGSWEAPARIALDGGDKLFATFKIDTDFDGSGEELAADTPEWVYFNIPGSTGLQDVDDDESIYIVLQAEGGSDSGSYFKIYYDDSDEPGYIHTGGYGEYIASGGFCPSTGGTPVTCDESLTDTGTAKIGGTENPRADFHFRVYSQGDGDDNYENSLQVFGELHADEAIGASVIGEGSSANKDIAFVGRRFASAFWKDRHAHARLWGHSFVQQLDNCDLGGSGTETVGDDIESRRGWRPFCDSQVRDVAGATYGDSNDRRYSANTELYSVDTDTMTRFYCNPYKNAGNVTHGGTAFSCTQDSPFNTYTPYEFNTMAQASGRGCYVGCGNGENTSCGSSDVNKTHYIYPIPDETAYGKYPYNFCKYAGGTTDSGHEDEPAFKDMLDTQYNVAVAQDLYLPKAPPQKGPWPISDSKINGWIGSIFPSGCLGATTITASQSWSAPTCIDGSLVIRNGAKLTLNGGAHIYVKGNLHLVKDAGKNGGRIEMNNSAGVVGWNAHSVGLVIVDGFVDTEKDTQLAGGSKSDDEYLLVISRSTNKGDYDPYDWAGGTAPASTENDKAAIYHMSHQEGGATVSLYAPRGSVVLERDATNPNAMQVAAHKVVMRRGTQITYDYGILDMLLPGGPASASGVSDYDEIAP